MGQLEIAFAIDFGYDKVPDFVAAKAPTFGGGGWGLRQRSFVMDGSNAGP